MKKFYQIVQCVVAPNESKLFLEQLKEEYSRCSGIFVIKSGNTNVEDLTINMKIAGVEVLPLDTDVAILTFNGQYSVKQATYDFSADKMPARSSTTELTITNKNAANPANISVYYVLEND